MKRDKDNIEKVDGTQTPETKKRSLKKPIIITVAVVVLIAIILSLGYCMMQGNNGDPKPPITSSSDTPVINDNVDDGNSSDSTEEGESEEGEFDEGEYDEAGIIIERPYTDGAISSGVKISFTLGDEETPEDADENIGDNEGEDDVWDGSKFDEAVVALDIDYNEYTWPKGTATASDERVIKVNNTSAGVMWTDFMGIGCNHFPTNGSYLAQVGNNQVGAYSEIDAKRYNDAAPRYARTWFQIDWIVTNELEKQGKDYNDYKHDWESNPDYVNYMNGVYSWENDEFLAFVDSCKMLEEVGCEVYLAYGWKVGARVADWFSNHPTNPQQGTPRDTLAYAKAAAALFKYMRYEQNLSNFNIIAFYNEPNQNSNYENRGTDFFDVGDNRVAMVNIIKDVYNVFKADEQLDDVLIMASDTAAPISNDSNTNMNVYLKRHVDEMIDAYTYHYYYPIWDSWRWTPGTYVAHDEYYKFAAMCRDWFKGEDQMILNTEYYAGTWSNGSWDSIEYQGWLGSNTSEFIQTANSGTNGLFKWSFGGSYIADPVGGPVGDFVQGSYKIPKNGATISQIFETYYSDTILNQYIERDSDVLKAEWTGEDLHVAAFNSNDGKNFAMVVESSDKQTATRNLKIKLEKSLGGKTIYVYKHSFATRLTANATIPQAVKTIKNVTKEINFTLPGEYGAYVFSTIAPRKQIEVFVPGTNNAAVYNECDVDGTVDIEYKRIDAQESDEIVWEVKRYSCAIEYDNNGVQLKRKEKTASDDLGIIAHDKNAKTITYTPAADAKVGDVIAIRGTYKGTNRFTTTMVVIK